jgi:hypothetical protein
MPDASGIEAMAVLAKELVTTLKVLHDAPPTWFTSGQPSITQISTSMHEALALLRDLFPTSTTCDGTQRVNLPSEVLPSDHGPQRVITDVPRPYPNLTLTPKRCLPGLRVLELNAVLPTINCIFYDLRMNLTAMFRCALQIADYLPLVQASSFLIVHYLVIGKLLITTL